MSIREIISLECGCEKCRHVWKTRKNKPPEVCPKCKRRDWNFAKVVEAEKEVERIQVEDFNNTKSLSNVEFKTGLTEREIIYDEDFGA